MEYVVKMADGAEHRFPGEMVERISIDGPKVSASTLTRMRELDHRLQLIEDILGSGGAAAIGERVRFLGQQVDTFQAGLSAQYETITQLREAVEKNRRVSDSERSVHDDVDAIDDRVDTLERWCTRQSEDGYTLTERVEGLERDAVAHNPNGYDVVIVHPNGDTTNLAPVLTITEARLLSAGWRKGRGEFKQQTLGPGGVVVERWIPVTDGPTESKANGCRIEIVERSDSQGAPTGRHGSAARR